MRAILTGFAAALIGAILAVSAAILLVSVGGGASVQEVAEEREQEASPDAEELAYGNTS